MKFRVWGNFEGVQMLWPKALEINTWYRIYLEYNNGTWKLYVAVAGTDLVLLTAELENVFVVPELGNHGEPYSGTHYYMGYHDTTPSTGSTIQMDELRLTQLG
jgi:hypothetical protein